MKKIFFISLAASAAMLLAGCHFGNGFSVFNDDDDNGRNVTTMEVNNGDDDIKIEYAGDIAFTDDETTVKSISAGGCLKYWKNGRKIIAESNKDGVIYWQLYNGSKNFSINDVRGKQLVTAAIKDLIGLGFDAKARVDRLYKKGGATAVLDEIDYLKGNYVRSLYFEQLLNTKYLTVPEMVTTAKSIGVIIDGNYEKQELLKKFASAFMANPQTSKAYFDAVNTLTGDYEKENTLEAIIKEPLTKTQLGQVIDIAGTINGNYEKSEVLKAIIAKTGLSAENCDKLLDVTASLTGDFEKQGVLSDLADSDSLTDENFNRMLFVTGHINGDYEKSEVLKKIAAQDITSDDEWVSLINASTTLNGNNEKSGVMIAIAQKMPKDDKVKTAYMETAKTINSDYEYAQAVKATQQ